MESLLSLSFDYLSSFDGIKIKKGLRQLEGLLAQICLSSSKATPNSIPSSSSASTAAAERRRSIIDAAPPLNGGYRDDRAAQPKELASLKDDPAFREFFKLQEGFEWNGKRNIFRTFWLEDEGQWVVGFDKVKIFEKSKLRICEIYSCHKTDSMFGEITWKGQQ